MRGHTPGPGLKVLDHKTRWYGGGYCRICSSRGDELIPQAVRWWDADDGWKMGVLCSYCGEEAAERGPRKDDYAWKAQDGAERIDTLASLGDLDSTYSDGLDR